MSDGSLTQDEIDALLQGTDTIEMDGGDASMFGGISDGGLGDTEKNAFRSILASAVDSQSSNISMLAGQNIKIEKPAVYVKSKEQILKDLSDEVVSVKLNFSDGVSGEHMSLLNVNLAKQVASLMLGQEGIDLNDMALSAIGEAMSNIISPALTTIGNKIGSVVKTAVPEYKRKKRNSVVFPRGDSFVTAEYPVIMGNQNYKLIDVYSIDLVNSIVSQTGVSSNSGGLGNMSGNQENSGSGFQPGNFGQQSSPINMGNQPSNSGNFGTPNVQPVQFANLQNANVPMEQGNIGLLMDVNMEMTVELGRTKRLIKDILGIGEGTIIELDKLAGEPVDILVNHKLIAKGEVVVIDENFGVRVTEIVSPLERMGDLT
ncbi:MAG: flagellar motor switch phosphatase FliY [Spirochaetales bacterium]|nr:flagellar motor switch phosphatase FliY [Spirochaetales bacterium]